MRLGVGGSGNEAGSVRVGYKATIMFALYTQCKTAVQRDVINNKLCLGNCFSIGVV